MSKISIIIPSLLRPSVLETVRSCAELAADSRVEIIVSVNPLCFDNPQTEDVLKNLKEFPYIRIETQSKRSSTAESSAFNSIVFAKHEWVWFLGDDDLVAPNALEEIVKLIDKPVDFWLVNCVLNYQSDFNSKYYEIGPKSTQIGRGLDLFKKFGLVTATTTLSCLVVRKDILDLEFFSALHDIQGIYSHSFFLFAMLHDCEVGVSDFPFVLRTEANSEQVRSGLEKYSSTKNQPFYYLFTSGLFSLVKAVSMKTSIPVGEILRFRELEIIKNVEIVSAQTHKILVSNLGSFIVAASKSTSRLDPSLTVLDQELAAYDFGGADSALIMNAPVRVSLSSTR